MESCGSAGVGPASVERPTKATSIKRRAGEYGSKALGQPCVGQAATNIERERECQLRCAQSRLQAKNISRHKNQ